MGNTEWTEQYIEATEVLIEYGWIISPFMIGKDFEKVYQLALKIKSNPPSSDTEKQNWQTQINILLTDIIFHPLFRAFYVQRAKDLNHLKNFSHHLERAILHYYKNDYFSAVHCLIPAIEGSLLSYFGWEHGKERKPQIKHLINEVGKCRTPVRNRAMYSMYSKAMVSFLNKWIFSDTDSNDTTFSYLNRHYILHGMGNNNYYSLSDAHRLIVFFDIFIEFLSLEQKIWYNFIPDENVSINKRSEYYFNFIENNLKKDEILKVENQFMEENPFYVAEPMSPNWKDIRARAAQEFLDFLIEQELPIPKKRSIFSRLFKKKKH